MATMSKLTHLVAGALTVAACGEATAPPPPPPPAALEAPVRIQLAYVDPVPEAHRGRFQDAADYFMSVLAGTEVEPLTVRSTDPSCPFEGTIEGLLIQVRVAEGRGTAAGGPCRRRPDGILPLIGGMRFDPGVFDRSADADFERLVRHEMLHVLGFGTGPRWGAIRVDDTSPRHFPGPRAVEAFNAAGGEDYAGPKVPLLDDGHHWREDVMGCEVMAAGCGPKGIVSPTSAVTLGALADIGWTVDLSLADPYYLPRR